MITAEKVDALLMEMLIKYESRTYYGPALTADDLELQALPGAGGGYGKPHDPYGRGNKWGKDKSFNDYRGSL